MFLYVSILYETIILSFPLQTYYFFRCKFFPPYSDFIYLFRKNWFFDTLIQEYEKLILQQ